MSTSPPVVVADRYRLVAPLGQGGMGRVWRATDVVLHRDVAIKELVPPPGLTPEERQEMRERSLREARAIARLNNINVVRIFDVLRTDGDPWIVMEYVPSRSLQDTLASDGPFAAVRAAEIGLGVLNALRAAHRNGVVHRDVKPGNVLIGADGRVVLTDFGLATVPGDPNVTRTGLVLGSPAYIAPERARDGTAGPAADLWSLGATLYAAVEGSSPFARPSAIATLAALATENPPPARNAGPLKPVLNGLLRKDPTHRINAEEAERLLLRATGRRSKLAIAMNPTMRRPGVGRERPALPGPPPVVPGKPTSGYPAIPARTTSGSAGDPARPTSGSAGVPAKPASGSAAVPGASSAGSAPVVPGPRPPVIPGRPSSDSGENRPPVVPGRPGAGRTPIFTPGKATVGRAPQPADRTDRPKVQKLDATWVDAPPVRDKGPQNQDQDISGTGNRSTQQGGGTGTGAAAAGPVHGALARGSRGVFGAITPGAARQRNRAANQDVEPAPGPRAAGQAEVPRPASERSVADRPAAQRDAVGGADTGRDAVGGADTGRDAAGGADTGRDAVGRADTGRDAASGADTGRDAADRAKADREPAEEAQSEAVGRAAAQREATDRAAAQREVADRAAAERSDAERLAQEQAAVQRAAEERAAAEAAAAREAATEREALERAAAQWVARERAAADKVAAEKAAAERPAAERAAEEKAKAERAAAERAAAEKAAAEKAAAEKAAAEKAAAERAAEEKAAAEKAAVEEAAAEKAAAEQAAEEEAAASAVAESVAIEKAPDEPATAEKAEEPTEEGTATPAAAAEEESDSDRPDSEPTDVENAAEAERTEQASAEAELSGDKDEPSNVDEPDSADTGAADKTSLVPGGVLANVPALGGPARPAWQPMELRPRTSATGLTVFGTTLTRRQTVIAGAIVLALILIVLVVVMPKAFGDSTGGDAQTRNQVGAGPAASVQPTPSQSQTTKAVAPPPKSAAPSTPAQNKEVTLPAGWYLYKDPTGFSVPVPRGWSVRRQGSEVYFQENGGQYRLLIVDQTNSPKPDPRADWQNQESQRVSGYRNYHRIGITSVPYWDKAADWEFTRTSDNGNPLHVVKRGFITAPDQAYGITWSTSAGDWDANKANLDLIYQGFVPARS